jgi:site-specific DNA-methyltransferase (adenine-specific)
MTTTATRITQTFRKAQDTVIWGDALQALAADIPDASIDLIFVDPPYNVGKTFGSFKDRWPSDEAYAQWCYKWLDLCIDKLKSNGSMYVMTSTQCMPYLDLYVRDRLTILSRIVWAYDSSGLQAKSRYGSLYEPILYCVKDNRDYTFNADAILVEARTGATRRLIDYRKATPAQYNTTKVPGNVWNFNRVRYKMAEYEDHPAQKPQALLERIVLASSNRGDVVLDPFAGTFTACAVAQKLQRATIGIERELEYVKIGLRRLGIQTMLNGEPLTRPAK